MCLDVCSGCVVLTVCRAHCVCFLNVCALVHSVFWLLILLSCIYLRISCKQLLDVKLDSSVTRLELSDSTKTNIFASVGTGIHSIVAAASDVSALLSLFLFVSFFLLNNIGKALFIRDPLYYLEVGCSMSGVLLCACWDGVLRRKET